MSLRAFHIVFVTICTLLSVFLVAWAFWFSRETSGLVTGLGITGIVGLLLMPVYGFYFSRKTSKLHL